jgi:hypothetical protein
MPNKMDSFDIPDISSDLIHNKDHSISEKKKKKEDESGFDIPDVESDIISIEKEQKETSQIPEVKADIAAAKYMSGEIEPAAAPAQEKPRQEQFSLTPALGSGIPSLEKDIIKTEQAHEQPVRDIADDFGDQLEKTGPWATELPFVRKIAGDLSAEQREKLIERHKWVYGMLSPEQQDQYFAENKHSSPYNFESAKKDVGSFMQWVGTTGKAAVDVGLDFTAAYLTEPLKAAIENVPHNDRVKLAKEVLDADIRNVTGAIPNTLTESYRMLKKYYGAKTFSDLTERMGDSALNPDPVSLLPQLAGIFSLPTMIASMGRLNDPDAGGVAAIDNINTWITKDETTAKKHFKNRMESEAEDSANDWKTRQGSEKLSPWSQWMYSPFGQGVMLEREKSLLPSPEVYAATYGITEAEAAGRIEAIAEKNADFNSRDIAQKWNNEFDQAKQDFGGFVTGPMGMGPGGLALGAIGLAKKLGGAMEGIGLSDEAYNAYMRAKQARTIKATENSIEEAQKPRFYESGADYIVGQQAAAADWAKGMLESIPEGARPFLPVALKYAGLGGVGGAVGALVDPESPGMGALKGAGVLAGLGLAPRVVSDLGKARRAIGGGEGGVFKTAGQAPESAWATQKLFGGKTGAVADYLTENIGPLAKAGVHLGTLNLAMGTINSDTPSELISSTMQGMMMGSGFHSLGGGFRLLHEKPMREQMEDRKKRDVEIYHAVKSASPETQQQLNRIGDFENAINRSKLNTLMMEAKLQDALQSGDKKKVDEAQKAVNVARAIQKSMLRANLQTRSEYGRNFRSLYADIHALANGARSGQGRINIEVLTRDQIFDRLKQENDANNYGRTPEEMWEDSKRPGRYSKSKGTAIINADNIMNRQTLFGESPTQALRHEGFGHGLYNIPEFRKMNQAAERLLFDQQERALNGEIIKQSKGRYSDDDLISMYMNNYLKGSDPEKIQYARDMGLWDEANNTLNREATVQYMKEEVIAELNAGNLKYGLGALKKQGGAIEQWLEHNKDRNMVASALSSLTGMGAKPIYSELLETEFSPEVVAANREALKNLSKYNARFEEATEEQAATELPEKVLRSDSALRTRYSLNGGEYKTQMVAEVRDKNGRLVGRPLPVGENAAEGSWVHDENTNTIQKTRGYGQLQESAAIQVPLGGKVTVKRDFVYEPDGITPIRNSDKDINTLESNRVEAIRQALETDDRFGGQGLIPVSADGESYSGMLSPKQRKAIEDLPESIVPLSMKEKIFELNDALAMDDGSTFDIDYAPRLQGKKYKGRRAEIYGMIPVNWGLSKAGNFYIRSVSLGALFRKVKARKKLLPGWYEAWGGSTEAFMDEFRNTYLKNTKEGKPGWMGLDPSKPTEQTPLATLKQNKFNDMLNLANRPREITPRDPDKRKSKAGEVDTLWRSFRVDAIADMLNTPERKYPFDSKRVYENLMPREVSEEFMPREVAERDDAHRKAIDSGDMDAAQRLVDERAARKGYQIKAYHGTDAEKIDVFDMDMFGESTGKGDIGDGFYFATTPEFASEFGKNVMPVYLEKGKYATNKDLLDPDIQSAIDDDMGFKSVSEVLAEKGFDGIKYDRGNNKVEMVVFDNNKIKSADPATYDNEGNLIPLSRRFDTSKQDIRYQPRDVEEKLGAKPTAEESEVGKTVFSVTAVSDRVKLVDELVKAKNWEAIRDLNQATITHAFSDIPGLKYQIRDVVGAFENDREISASVEVYPKDAEQLAEVRKRIVSLGELWKQTEVLEEDVGKGNQDLIGQMDNDGYMHVGKYVLEFDKLTDEMAENARKAAGVQAMTIDKNKVIFYDTDNNPAEFARRVRGFKNSVTSNGGILETSTGDSSRIRSYRDPSSPKQGSFYYNEDAVRLFGGTTPDRLRSPVYRVVSELLGRPLPAPEGGRSSYFVKSDVTPEQVRLQNEIGNSQDRVVVNDKNNKDVVKAYNQLNAELLKQFDALEESGMRFEATNDYESYSNKYKTSADVIADIRNNNSLTYLKTTPETFGPLENGVPMDFSFHPLLRDSGRVDANGTPMSYNDILRAVHDAIAHGIYSAQFGPVGEESAWHTHIRTIDNPWARWALTMETRAQNSFVNYRDARVDEKTNMPYKPGDANYVPLTQRDYAEQKFSLIPLQYVFTGDAKVDAPTRKLMAEIGEKRSQGSPSKPDYSYMPREVAETSDLYKSYKTENKLVKDMVVKPGVGAKSSPLIVTQKPKASGDGVTDIVSDSPIGKSVIVRPMPNIALDNPRSVTKDLTKFANQTQKFQDFKDNLIVQADKIAEDPERFANDKGYTEFMKASGAQGDIMVAPSGLAMLIRNPERTLELLNGGYHGDRTVPNSYGSAISGLDSVVEMGKLIGPDGPPPFITAIHHLWGILSKQLPPDSQEAMWMRLIRSPEILKQIQNSVDGNYSMSHDEWKKLVDKAMYQVEGNYGVLGNNAKANANGYHLMLSRHNGKWDGVSKVYTHSDPLQMRNEFWSLNAGPTGIKNKVQSFIGLTFGVKGSVLDRWRYVDLHLPLAMKLAGKTNPYDYFRYDKANVPEDPTGIYKLYGSVESGDLALSTILYAGIDRATQAAINNNARLREYLGNHADPGGYHWINWNAIKNEAVGHSSLDLTKSYLQKYGRDVNSEKFLNHILDSTVYVTGKSEGKKINLLMDKGVFRIEPQ